MVLGLFVFYAVMAAIILALGRGLLVLLRLVGVQSVTLSFAFALGFGILVTPTLVAGHGIGFVPWILSPGDAGWGFFLSPLTCLCAWLAMGRPSPTSESEPQRPQSPTSGTSTPASPVLRFPDEDRPA